MNQNASILVNGEIYQKKKLILRKNAKVFYTVEGHPELLIMRFLDLVTSDNGQKKQKVPGKGQTNAQINNMLFELLRGRYTDKHQTVPIKTHYIGASEDSPTECLVSRMAQAIPLEVIVRNRAYGSFVEKYAKSCGVKYGDKFERPLCEFTLKDNARNDPLIAWDHIWALDIASGTELEHMREVALVINGILCSFFREINIELIDFKLVFGRQDDVYGDFTNLRLISDISPDTCRLHDLKTGIALDKDIFRQGLPGLAEAYAAVSRKMEEFAAAEMQKKKFNVGAYDKYGNALK